MCIIIDNRAGEKLSKEIINRSISLNGDGFGFFDAETGEVKRTMSPKKMKKMLKSRKPFIAHCRYATVGVKNISNVHPFEFEKGWMMQNGTVGGFRDSRSDSANLADLLNHVPVKKVEDFLSSFDSRFLVRLEKSGEVIKTGKWFEHEGVSYSKDNVLKPESSYDFWTDSRPASGWRTNLRSRSAYKESSMWGAGSSDVGSGFEAWGEESPDPETSSPTGDKHLVAVYGTLKEGLGNHRYLESSKKIANVVTRLPYRLCAEENSLPYLITGTHADGHNVNMELYEVSTPALKSIDGLEGHPDFYERTKITVCENLNDKSSYSAWVYFVGSYYDSGNYVSEYTGRSRRPLPMGLLKC